MPFKRLFFKFFIQNEIPFETKVKFKKSSVETTDIKLCIIVIKAVM
ncbi:hypothetical protein B4140_1768 [Bacillus amyloliquefaciens]|nr:hypothetical protein B4140_1768 [Bacillus amyloliquefaciens]